MVNFPRVFRSWQEGLCAPVGLARSAATKQSPRGLGRGRDAGFGERGDLAWRVAERAQHRLGLLAERGDKGFRGGFGVRHAEGRVERAERAALVVDLGERAALRELWVVHRFLDGAIRR